MKFLILDTSVVLDYLKSEPSILSLASHRLGECLIASLVLHREIDQLDPVQCEELGIRTVEENQNVITEAATRDGDSGLSFYDWLSILLAKEHGYVVVTNDQRQYRICEKEGVVCMRGLRIMLELVSGGHLEANEAEEISKRISKVNGFITPEVLSMFSQALNFLRSS